LGKTFYDNLSRKSIFGSNQAKISVTVHEVINKLKTTLKGRRFQTLEEIQENARCHRKCVPGSIPTMEETFGTVYRQCRGLL